MRKLSIKMSFFKQGEDGMNPEGKISGNYAYYCSEEVIKKTWMREKKIKLFMQLELEACRNELDWMARVHDCLLNSCPEEDFPPMPRPISSTYVTFNKEDGNSKKGFIATYIKYDSQRECFNDRGGAGIRRFCLRRGHQNNPFRG